MALALLKFPFKILNKKKVVHSARALMVVNLTPNLIGESDS